LERVVAPALAAHNPDLILVSCGFDGAANDPSGRMLLTSQDYRRFTTFALEQAARHCAGRLVVCHEGGYSPTYVPFCGVAVIEELCGLPEADRIADPFLARYTGVGYEQIQPHQTAALDQVLAYHPQLAQP
jgi:acetoin utilization deacetylase AcuC-like enzyme